MLKYIANIQVNNPDAERHQYDTPRFPRRKRDKPQDGLKLLLDTDGPEAVKDWVLGQKKLLITDTTMRDAHQSLLSTRLRTRDMLKGADGTADILADCFSLEMWGGATFDTAYRFLHESPWERLEMLREKIPNIPFQMLLRGSNMVGLCQLSRQSGAQLYQGGGGARASTCSVCSTRSTGCRTWRPPWTRSCARASSSRAPCATPATFWIPSKDRYTLKYYVDLAKELERRGAHMLAIKDMSGLLKPYAAKKLVSTLKQEIGIPIHLHTHNTTDNQIAALLMAAEAGVDVVDTAIGPLANLTSQPSMNAVVDVPARSASATPALTCSGCRSCPITGPTCACGMRASTRA